MSKMHFCKTAAFLCCLVIWWNSAALADKEEASDEVGDDQDLKTVNETSSVPDSHEAMHNRDIFNQKIRQKRSYEFLMGLINNNSRYEVTKVDPAVVTDKPKIPNEGKVAATELLLELMVRIASHPQQWEKVHKLLQKLDRDLATSKNIVTKLQTHSSLTTDSNDDIYINKKINPKTNTQEQEAVMDRRKNHTKSPELKWPTFDDDDAVSGDVVKFVNSSSKSRDVSAATDEGRNKYLGQTAQNKTAKVTYPKSFSYHRVTGKPIHLNKTPKAYIAVSVVAAKPEEEDVALENELHRLKPWSSHPGKSSSSLRPNSVIRTQQSEPRL